MNDERGTRRRLRGMHALAGATFVAALAIGGCSSAQGGDQVGAGDRLAEVKSRGAQVMPFDLDKTTHRFTDRDDGGLQRVVANDPSDTTQIRLIRQHLTAEAARFSRGDYADPKQIHGEQMPGVAELSAGAGRITIRYDEVPAGATLRFVSTDDSLVDAIHRWFAAQRSDHGAHGSS